MRPNIGSERLIALTDGVVAVIITIMVLELSHLTAPTWPALYDQFGAGFDRLRRYVHPRLGRPRGIAGSFRSLFAEARTRQQQDSPLADSGMTPLVDRSISGRVQYATLGRAVVWTHRLSCLLDSPASRYPACTIAEETER